MLYKKVDVLIDNSNEMRADYQQQNNKLEDMLTKIIMTLRHT